MDTAPPLLRTHGVTRRFGNLTAVEDLSLQVHEGDIYGFLGLNGAGKTTTLRMILGLIRPSKGEIELFGSRARRVASAARTQLGAMVEGPAFFPRLSALRNMLALGRISGSFSRTRAMAILDEVGLSHAAHRAAGTFSLGMKQRLGIALALAPSPRLVILDEPTNGLDPRGIRDMRALIRRWNAQEGVTFLVSSHLLHEVESLCNRVLILHEGRLVSESSTQELLRGAAATVEVRGRPRPLLEQALERLHLRFSPVAGSEGLLQVEADPVRIPEIARALLGEGVDIEAIAPRRVSLEELFLERTEGLV